MPTRSNTIFNQWETSIKLGKKALAILIDPEKFVIEDAFAKAYIAKIPSVTTHILVGGSSDTILVTQNVVQLIKKHCALPVLLFPGDHHQITPMADGLLFLSLLSGRNPKYLIDEHIRAVPAVRKTALEIIPTGYILIDGGTESSVARISNTIPISQNDMEQIVHTAIAGELMGKKCIYLEAGSGALIPVKLETIKAVKKQLTIPLIVGGGIRSQQQLEAAYKAGADMVVMGTVFE